MIINDEILNSIEHITKKYDCYLVGGYIRNLIIENKNSNDRDIVCLNNTYSLTKEIADFFNGTLIELDNDNKIYRIVLKDKTNYLDVSEALNNNIMQDASRRDFTINSIFYNLNKKEIFDPFNGIQDIKNKIIKTSNLNNLKDDPLRFLRLYRFYSKTNFKIEKNLEEFAIENFNLINTVAKERINQEIMLIFESERTAETLLKMYNDNTLNYIFPFVDKIKKIPKNSHHHLDLIHHSIETVKNISTNKALLKLAAFYHDIGKPQTWSIDENGRHRFIGHDIIGSEIVKSELENLKFSNKQIAYISKIIRHHIYPSALINCNQKDKKAFARFTRKIGNDSLDLIELAKADRLSAKGIAITEDIIQNSLNHLENLKNYYLEIENKIKNPKPLLNGNEIMELLNIKPSKLIKEITENLIELALLNEITTKEEAKTYLLKNYKK